MEVKEAQIEDILAGAPLLTKELLQLSEEPLLLGRQIIIPSGRLDLLYTYRTQLLLLELKVTAFQHRFVRQLLDYRTDLIALQRSGQLIGGNIQPYLLCTSARQDQRELCEADAVLCSEYDPEYVLRFFYERLRPVASFTEVKPIDIGVWSIHLIHRLLYLLETTNSVRAIRESVHYSQKTL